MKKIILLMSLAGVFFNAYAEGSDDTDGSITWAVKNQSNGVIKVSSAGAYNINKTNYDPLNFNIWANPGQSTMVMRDNWGYNSGNLSPTQNIIIYDNNNNKIARVDIGIITNHIPYNFGPSMNHKSQQACGYAGIVCVMFADGEVADGYSISYGSVRVDSDYEVAGDIIVSRGSAPTPTPSPTPAPASKYSATFSNVSPVDLKIKTGGNVVANIAAGTKQQSLTLDPYTTYSVVYSGTYADQGAFTIQKYTDLVIQNTPVAAASGLQDLQVNYSSNNKQFVGSFNNILQGGQPKFSGDCKKDGSSGVVCTIANNDRISSLLVDVSGGSAPTPVAAYTCNQGNWSSTDVYAPINTTKAIEKDKDCSYYNAASSKKASRVKASNGQVYPKVTYNTQDFVACWWAAAGQAPGQDGGPWKLYNPNKNVCN